MENLNDCDTCSNYNVETEEYPDPLTCFDSDQTISVCLECVEKIKKEIESYGK